MSKNPSIGYERRILFCTSPKFSHSRSTLTICTCSKRYVSLLILMCLGACLALSQPQTTPDACAQRVDSLALAIAACDGIFHPDVLQNLHEWESICGYSEPAERLRLLMSIAGGVYAAETHRDYLEEGIRRYISRLREAEMPDSKQFYEKHKAWFCYLPLNHPFDEFTKEIAEALLPKLIRGTGEYLMCTLLSGQYARFQAMRVSKAFRNTPYHTVQKTKKPVVPIVDKQFAFAARTGLWFPWPNTDHYQGIGWLGSISTAAKMTEQYIFEGQLDFIKAEPLDSIWVYGRRDQDGGDILGQIHFGVGFARRFLHGKRNFYELQSGLTGAWLITDIEKEDPNIDEEFAESIALGTFHIPVGCSYVFGTRRGHAVGLGAKYHLRPFALDRRLRTPMSMGSTSIALHFYF